MTGAVRAQRETGTRIVSSSVPRANVTGQKRNQGVGTRCGRLTIVDEGKSVAGLAVDGAVHSDACRPSKSASRNLVVVANREDASVRNETGTVSRTWQNICDNAPQRRHQSMQGQSDTNPRGDIQSAIKGDNQHNKPITRRTRSTAEYEVCGANVCGGCRRGRTHATKEGVSGTRS
jgi:hypothetical protein